MTERADALSGLLAAARALSAATHGKAGRGDLPREFRSLLAGIDGALARLDAADGRLPAHWGEGKR